MATIKTRDHDVTVSVDPDNSPSGRVAMDVECSEVCQIVFMTARQAREIAQHLIAAADAIDAPVVAPAHPVRIGGNFCNHE